jgi:hypothetical protein
MDKISIITGCTPEYMKKLMWCLPTWKMKPQFENAEIVIFYSGMKSSDLYWVKDYFKDWTFVDWKMLKYDNVRELILSSFILGHNFIKTEYSVKLDADTYFTDSRDIFDEDDFKQDLVSHKWGYTKPGYWIDQLDNFFNGTDKPIDLNKLLVKHKRIQSICCLQKTSMLREIADCVGDRLPVPSHDTVLWYYANKYGLKIKRKNIKKFGVGHCASWRKIREDICANKTVFNPYLNKELFKHVQLEITSDCQLKCDNCDRNCGKVKPESMSVAQVWKFVEESLKLNHEWSRIDIIGGEPTLHPKLETLFEMIKIYKNRFPNCKIRFSSNGLGQKTKEVLKTIPNWVEVRNSNKTSKHNSFEAYNSAPIDNGEKHVKSCSIPWRCGLGLTSNGYFLCGAGASIAKVFEFDIGVMNLSELTIDKLKEQRNILCKYCGHSNCSTKHMVVNQETSKSWEEAFKKENKKKLKRY